MWKGSKLVYCEKDDVRRREIARASAWKQEKFFLFGGHDVWKDRLKKVWMRLEFWVGLGVKNFEWGRWHYGNGVFTALVWWWVCWIVAMKTEAERTAGETDRVHVNNEGSENKEVSNFIFAFISHICFLASIRNT